MDGRSTILSGRELSEPVKRGIVDLREAGLLTSAASATRTQGRINSYEKEKGGGKQIREPLSFQKECIFAQKKADRTSLQGKKEKAELEEEGEVKEDR